MKAEVQIMKTFSDIKQEAKNIFLANYMPFVLAAFILAFVNGTLTGARYNRGSTGGSHVSLTFGPVTISQPLSQLSGASVLLIVFMAVIAVIGAIMIDLYIKNPIEYGCRSWFRHQAAGDDSVHITDIYRSGDLKRVGWTMLYRDLTIFLYTFLLIIPGIIKALEYYFVPQILEDHPELSEKEVLQFSSDMMYGRKMELFEFLLTFLGWWLLGAVTMGLSRIFFSNPYQTMSEQLLYEEYVRQDDREAEEKTDSEESV